MARGPHLWVLHLGYAWVAVGLLLLGASIASGILSMTAALHVLTAGPIGTMPLAVMSRATLGHTDQPLPANRITTLTNLIVTCAALMRVLSPTLGELSTPALHVSATLWIITLAGFAVIYAPIFFGQRADGTGS